MNMMAAGDDFREKQTKNRPKKNCSTEYEDWKEE